MSASIALKNIKKVSVVDDDALARDGIVFSLQEAGLEAVQEDGPLRDLKSFLTTAANHSDAAVCDHHLRKKNYANFNGSEAVAQWYKQQFPAILCTRLDGGWIEEIRPQRRFIPVLLKPIDVEPDSVIHGFEVCLGEFEGVFLPSRKPWRTLVRLDDVEVDGQRQIAHFVVPGWNSNERIPHHLVQLPLEVRHRLSSQKRFHASVNLGAESRDDLYFSDWELS